MDDQKNHDYLAGKRIYRGSGHGPSPGTKDPSGYIKREQSNSRSGLAAAALRLKDKMGQENVPQQPMIPQVLTPVGKSGLMKDSTGRLYNGSPPQTQA